MATLASSTSKAETSSQQIMDPHHDSIHAIRPHTGEKLNGKNWSAFEFGFVAHLIGYDLVGILLSKEREKAINNKVYSILVATLDSNQYVLIKKTSTSVQAWASLKSFYRKKG
jgi:hypothetical protein